MNPMSGVSVPQWPKHHFASVGTSQLMYLGIGLVLLHEMQLLHPLMRRNLRQSHPVILQVSRAAGNVWPGAVARAQKEQVLRALGHGGLQQRMPQ